MAAYMPPGRREADQLLLLLLRQNGFSVPAGVTSVRQLSSDAIIEAVGSVMPGIDGSPPPQEAFSTKGRHPAERHRACKVIASRVRDAGYSEPLPMHELMYPAQEGTHKLLRALLSMLPPDGAPSPPPSHLVRASGADAPATPSDLLTSDPAHENEGVPVDAESMEGVPDPSVPTRLGSEDLNDREAENVEGLSSQDEENEDDSQGPRLSGDVDDVAEDTWARQGDESGGTMVDRNDDGISEARQTSGEIEADRGDQGAESQADTDGPALSGTDGRQSDASGPESGDDQSADEEHSAPISDAESFSGTGASDGGGDSRGTRNGEAGDALISSQSGRVEPGPDEEQKPEQDDALGGLDHPKESSGKAGLIEVGDNNGIVSLSEESEAPGGQGSAPFFEGEETRKGFRRQEDGLDDAGGGDGGIEPGEDGVVGKTTREGKAVEISKDKEGSEDRAPDAVGVPSPRGAEQEDVDGGRDTVPPPPTASAEIVRAESPEEQQDDGEDQKPAPTEAAAAASPDDDINETAAAVAAGGDRNAAGTPSTSADTERGSKGSMESASDGPGPTADGRSAAGAQAEGVDHVPRQGSADDELDRRDGDDDGLLDSAGSGPGGDDRDTEAVPPVGGEIGGKEGVIEGEDSGDDDVVFLQFEVEAKEVELKRLLAEESTTSTMADELEEEVRRLGVLAEEREKHCRYAAKALELLPNAADEATKLQEQCIAAETRIRNAHNAFGKTRKPLEEVVRGQREELTRRKARCRALLTEMRVLYEECEEMSKLEHALRASARGMEEWERRRRGEIVVGGGEGEDEDDGEWAEEENEDEEDVKRRKAGVLLRTEVDGRIASLCEEAMAQKQEIAISLSEVLDARRETNSAWALLGRSEALSEEKLFAAAKEVTSGGGNKDRGKALIEAFRRLKTLGGLFSQLVEAVAEAGKREEECRSMEDESEKALSNQAGTTQWQLLSRDLGRVREDAFLLEQRLDAALEEERIFQEQRAEEEALKAQEDGDREDVQREQAVVDVESIRASSSSGGRSGAEEEQGPRQEYGEDEKRALSGARHEHIVGDAPAPREDEFNSDGSRVEQRGAQHSDYNGIGSGDGGVFSTGDGEVDFVGEDEEDNVWQ